MSVEKTENLNDFLNKEETVFENILKSDDWFIDDRLKESAQTAWEEIKNNTFKKFISEMGDTKSEGASLADVGLSGKQLVFKTCVTNYFFEKQLIQKALDAIDIILRSLSVVFPEIAEALKEFKDFLLISKKS